MPPCDPPRTQPLYHTYICFQATTWHPPKRTYRPQHVTSTLLVTSNYSGLLTTFGGSQEVVPAGCAAAGCTARRNKTRAAGGGEESTFQKGIDVALDVEQDASRWRRRGIRHLSSYLCKRSANMILLLCLLK